MNRESVNNMWESVLLFVPKLVGFLAILIIGYIIAKVIAKVIAKLLDRVGFNRAVEKGGIKQALAKSKLDASDILAKVVFYGLFLFVLTQAFNVFGPNPISDLLQSVIAYLPKLFVAVLIIVIASVIATAVREVIDATLGGLSYGKMLGNLAGGAIIVLGVFAALTQLEIAEAVILPLLYTILAVIGGSAIIAIGGGGIQPMRARWENALTKYDQEKENIRTEVQNTSSDDLKQRAQERKQQVQSSGQSSSQAGSTPSTGTPTIQLPEDQTTRRV